MCVCAFFFFFFTVFICADLEEEKSETFQPESSSYGDSRAGRMCKDSSGTQTPRTAFCVKIAASHQSNCVRKDTTRGHTAKFINPFHRRCLCRLVLCRQFFKQY